MNAKSQVEADGEKRIDPNTTSGSRWLLPATLVAWILIVALGNWRYDGISVKSKAAPEDQFSAERALVYLEDLVGNGVPHPAGSEANKKVQEKIRGHLRRMGYKIKLQNCEVELVGGETVSLVNIMAYRKETDLESPDRKLIAVVTHSDAKGKAPGAGDDGAGVAASLEVARMLMQRPRLNHDILFLITDGEELGLLGAKEFVDKHPLAKHIDLVINLEARGTSGPSLMFETHPDNSVSVRQFSAASPKPFCGSLFYEIYKKLPNDTDFTVFKKAGIPGFNFAFIGDAENYHAMSDSIQNLDLKSLQHHGENLLSLINKLDQEEKFLPEEAESKFSVYFDLMGWFVISWPASWSWFLWVVGAVGCGFVLVLIRDKSLQPITMSSNTESVPPFIVWFNTSRIVRACFWTMIMLGASLMALFAIHAGLLSGEAIQRGWVNDALFLELGYWSVAICALYVCVWLADQMNIERQTAMVVVALWVALGLLTIIYVNGASYLLIMPLLTTALLAIVPAMIFRQRAAWWTYLIFAISVGFFWLPMERMFYDAVGFKINLFLIVRVAIVTTSLYPIACATRDNWVPHISMLFAFLGFATSIFCVVWA